MTNTYLAPDLLGKSHQPDCGDHDLHYPINAGSEEPCRGSHKTDGLENLRRVVVDGIGPCHDDQYVAARVIGNLVPVHCCQNIRITANEVW